jgi:hypothetical protein
VKLLWIRKQSKLGHFRREGRLSVNRSHSSSTRQSKRSQSSVPIIKILSRYRRIVVFCFYHSMHQQSRKQSHNQGNCSRRWLNHHPRTGTTMYMFQGTVPSRSRELYFRASKNPWNKTTSFGCHDDRVKRIPFRYPTLKVH